MARITSLIRASTQYETGDKIEEYPNIYQILDYNYQPSPIHLIHQLSILIHLSLGIALFSLNQVMLINFHESHEVHTFITESRYCRIESGATKLVEIITFKLSGMETE